LQFRKNRIIEEDHSSNIRELKWWAITEL